MTRTQLSINPDDVHIWKYRMTIWKRGFLSVLSEEEKLRWMRFHSEDSQRRYAQAHAFVRFVLERYTGTPAAELKITRGHNKKPQLDMSLGTPLHFNLSYRDDYALLAISTHNPVGVDIESVKKIDHISSFIGAYFSYEEKQKVLGFKNLYDRLAMVFSIWVMKEALIKAKSTGLSESLTQYNLCPFLEQPECVPDFDTPNTWHIARFQVADNYKAACAVRSPQANFKMFEYGHD
jgi:4'-phosphopantetheinyl transferase